MKFRKKPVVIEADQFIPNVHVPEGMHLWLDEKGMQPKDMTWGYVDTLEGRHHVMAYDWIITGVKGEKYPCKDDIFKMTYEKADKKIDKIIQITDTLTDEIEGQTLGLSASGKLYFLKYKKVDSLRQEDRWIPNWELLIDSPNI